MKRIALITVPILVIGLALFVVVRYYDFVFAKTVTGVILNVQRVSQPEAIIASGRPIPTEQIFSMAVAIKDHTGEIHTSSSEDRQWAVAQAGQCAEAKFFPYPPWNLDKAGTYYGARLLKLFDCPQPGATK